MLRNKKVLLTLVTILALASFGFTSFGAISSITSATTNSVAVQSLPAASSSLVLTTSRCDGDNDADDVGCHSTTFSPFQMSVLNTTKVGPQLAGICALGKQPAGSVVDSVTGPSVAVVNSDIATNAGPIGAGFPYYQVVVAQPNGALVNVFINAVNCNRLPGQP